MRYKRRSEACEKTRGVTEVPEWCRVVSLSRHHFMVKNHKTAGQIENLRANPSFPLDSCARARRTVAYHIVRKVLPCVISSESIPNQGLIRKGGE